MPEFCSTFSRESGDGQPMMNWGWGGGFSLVLHYCENIFFGPQGSWSVHVCCLHLKMEFRSCARGRQWCGIIHNY